MAEADLCQLRWAFGGERLHWAVALYSGGGVAGVTAALQHLENFANWRITKPCPVSIRPFPVRISLPESMAPGVYVGQWNAEMDSSPQMDLKLLPPPARAGGHLSIFARAAEGSSFVLEMSGNTYVLRARMDEMQIEGQGQGSNYKRVTKQLTLDAEVDKVLIKTLGSMLSKVAHYLRFQGLTSEQQAFVQEHFKAFS